MRRLLHCRTGRAHMCEHTKILGVDRDGAFAEYVVVPESVIWQNDRAKLPPEIATLQEPFGNAVFALSHVDVAGQSVAILGCGPVGLFSIGIARASGAVRVLASDPKPFRLGLAARMGASAALDTRTVDDAAAWFVEQNEGEHVDVVFEMSGAPQAIADAFKIARNGGRVILFGIPARAGEARHRRGAHLQEPRRLRRQRPPGLGHVVSHAVAARARRRRPAPADHRRARPRRASSAHSSCSRAARPARSCSHPERAVAEAAA